jgi:hypothetical protein
MYGRLRPARFTKHQYVEMKTAAQTRGTAYDTAMGTTHSVKPIVQKSRD